MLDRENPYPGRRRGDRRALEGRYRPPPADSNLDRHAEPGDNQAGHNEAPKHRRTDILDVDQSDPLAAPAYPWALHAFRVACADQWTPDGSDLDLDRQQWHGARLSADERTLVQRNLAFFSVASAVVANRLMTALYRHIGAAECRQFLVRQAFEESLHLHTYRHITGSLGLDTAGLARMGRKLATIADKLAWIAPLIQTLSDPGFRLRGTAQLQDLLRGLIAFYAIFDGIFYHVGFIQVMSMGRRGKLVGSSTLLQRVLRDKRRHTDFGVELINQVKVEHPALWSKALQTDMVRQLRRAVDLETRYAYDSMPRGVLALNAPMFEEHLRFVANRRCRQIGLDEQYPGATDPFPWLQATLPLADASGPPATQHERGGALHWDD